MYMLCIYYIYCILNKDITCTYMFMQYILYSCSQSLLQTLHYKSHRICTCTKVHMYIPYTIIHIYTKYIFSICTLGWHLFPNFLNHRLSPSKFVRFLYKIIPVNFKVNWIIFRGSSKALKFCITDEFCIDFCSFLSISSPRIRINIFHKIN